VLVQIATGEKPFGDGASFVLINSAKIKKKEIKKSRFQGVDAPEPVQKAAYHDISSLWYIGKFLFDFIGSVSLEDFISYYL
jgi:hypothetical protein